MTEMQEGLLEIFRWFHSFCEENDLRYVATAGTLLGAVRHRGFIPWDDDLDVVMPRPDYERFLRLTENMEHPFFLVEYPKDKRDYTYPIAKIYDKRTTLVERTRYHTKRGLFLDVFPLDGVGNSLEEGRDTVRGVCAKLDLYLTLTCAWRKGRSLMKNLAVMAARLVPKFILDPLKLVKKIDMDAQAKGYEESSFVANIYSDYREKEVMKKEVIGEPILLEFEGLSIYAPQDSVGYLQSIYGAWQKLPPVEKQVSHHDFIHLDLNRSYLE